MLNSNEKPGWPFGANIPKATVAAVVPPEWLPRLWQMQYPSYEVLIFGPYDREGAIKVLSQKHDYMPSLAGQLTEITQPSMFQREVDLEDGSGGMDEWVPEPPTHRPAETEKPGGAEFLVDIKVDNAGGYGRVFKQGLTYWARRDPMLGFRHWTQVWAGGGSWYDFTADEVATDLQRLD